MNNKVTFSDEELSLARARMRSSILGIPDSRLKNESDITIKEHKRELAAIGELAGQAANRLKEAVKASTQENF